MPSSSLSVVETRSAQVAENVRKAWENRTPLDVRNATSWKPLHSYIDLMAKTPSTQSPSTASAPKRQEEQRQSPEAHAQVANTGAQHLNEDDLPSVGSKGHFDGTCKRCAFFPKGRCLNGKDCTHCHLPHESRPRNRKRRARRAEKGEESQEDEFFEEDGTGNANDDFSQEVVEAWRQHLASGSTLDLTNARLTTIDESEDEHTTKNAAAIQMSDDEMEPLASRHADRKDSISDCSQGDTGDLDSTSISSLEDVATSSSIDSESDAAISQMHDPAATASSEASSAGSSTSMASPTATQVDKGNNGSNQQRLNLSSSPKSWSAMRRKAGHDSEEVDLTRMTRAILNKLTEERFESLCSQVLALPVSTPEQLAVLVKEIFHKATTQNGFRALYTELCLRLDVHLNAKTGDVGGKAFRKALVNECQSAFLRSLQPPETSLFDNLNQDESFEMAMRLKTAILGNLRFIGDLLVHRLLSIKLLPPIVHTLLNGGEAELESLLALLEVIAPGIEGEAASYQAPVNDAFAVLRQRVLQKSICQRVRCRIQNLLDAKARGWAPRSSSSCK